MVPQPVRQRPQPQPAGESQHRIRQQRDLQLSSPATRPATRPDTSRTTSSTTISSPARATTSSGNALLPGRPTSRSTTRATCWTRNNDGVLNGGPARVGRATVARSSPWSAPKRPASRPLGGRRVMPACWPTPARRCTAIRSTRWSSPTLSRWARRAACGRTRRTPGSPTAATARWPAGRRPPDTDADGMPDAWETRYGLNPPRRRRERRLRPHRLHQRREVHQRLVDGSYP